MRRALITLSVALTLVRCASFEGVNTPDGEYIRYTSVNRATVLVRFRSEPAGARALLSCEKEDSQAFQKTISTPGNVRIPIPALCTVTFQKDGFVPVSIEVEPHRLAHRSALHSNPSCNDPGVWCDGFESIGKTLFASVAYGVFGLAARAFDPIRNGRAKVTVTLEPVQGDTP